MISKSMIIGAKVFHEIFGIGTFKGYECGGMFEGYAIIEFDEQQGQSLIHRRRLTELVSE